MILSGGGARGAYEVGVLWYIFDDLTRILGAPPRIDILSGTSVGAINACYLAAHLGDPVLGLRRLVELWTDLELTRVLGFGLRQVLTLPRVITGGGQGYGVFDLRPMAELVQREISWRAVSRCLRRQTLRALTVSCTEVSTGRTMVFMQT
ncbi:MAG TPA: patatin-like phospholipase family protein, partial [Polyangiaceae bacterium]|nr:patatin-like phospholipase family protein [Polyangiaceae bacterium]